MPPHRVRRNTGHCRVTVVVRNCGRRLLSKQLADKIIGKDAQLIQHQLLSSTDSSKAAFIIGI
jgi:hypothetical protein